MSLSNLKRFQTTDLTNAQVVELAKLAAQARADTLEMIAQAGSGHPGGALSSLDIFLMLWLCAAVSPDAPDAPGRDRIVVSHGHTAAGMYAVLGNLGYFDIEACKRLFRRAGSCFEGHPGLGVPGVEWCSGSLGQGLSVGCGFAIASRLRPPPCHVFVAMGDGEQAKGQVQEAREFAVKSGLDNLTAIVDANGLQASGAIADIMPQAIAQKYTASGWRVAEIDGHDYRQIYGALRKCRAAGNGPSVILARTVMGKGVSFIENRYEFHGQPIAMDRQMEAMNELRAQAACAASADRPVIPARHRAAPEFVEPHVSPGLPSIYAKDRNIECRTAFGETINDLAAVNAGNTAVTIAAVDCDLLESVRLRKFALAWPDSLIECGIQEHNAATVAAALSKSGILTFFVDFGVFAIDETYGQHRMSDLNGTSLKLIATHCGLDVGEDGKTHQCVDYLGILMNLRTFKILLPADANQTDRMIRYAATTPGNIAVVMGRSKLPVLTDEQDNVLFSVDRPFEYGVADWVRQGGHGVIVTCGSMVWRAVAAAGLLARQGVFVGVLNLCCPTHPDVVALAQAACTGLIVTYEDHHALTGIGGVVAGFLAESGLTCRFRRMGVTRIGKSDSPDALYRDQGLDIDSLVAQVKRMLAGS